VAETIVRIYYRRTIALRDGRFNLEQDSIIDAIVDHYTSHRFDLAQLYRPYSDSGKQQRG